MVRVTSVNCPPGYLMVYTVAQRRLYFVTDCVSGEGNAFGRVRPFVSIVAFAPTDLRPCYFACLGYAVRFCRTLNVQS